MNESITIRNGLYQYRKTRLPLLSGEFHYWRADPERWPAILAAIRDMGLQIVSTYVPWNFHELKPGRYDFTGRTGARRDLAGFLRLLKAEGFYAIVRPGPFIYAEWPHGGPPERAVRHDRLSPAFLKLARDYIRNVGNVLAPFQITRGGNLLLVQSDNEPYPPVENFGEAIGCFKRSGLFKTWLHGKYRGDIEALNRRWKTCFSSFDEACFYFHEPCANVELPLAARLLPGPDTQARYADSFEFIGWYAARIVETVKGWLVEAGIEVPIAANSWSPLYADFSRFCRVADLAGMDIYPNAFMEGATPTRDNWFTNTDILKMAEANVTGGNVWSAEFQSGLYPVNQVGYLPPHHFRFVPLTLMARGLKGWNWYMLVNRDNWHNAPINEWGRPNEYFSVHRQVVTAARRIEPWRLTPLYDLSVVAYKPHRVIAPGNFEAAVQALEAGDLNSAYFDPQADLPPKTPVLLYAGADWLDAAAFARLDRWVRAGGILVTFSRAPARDDIGGALDGLPFQPPDGARPTLLPVTVTYKKGSTVISQGGHLGCKVNFCYFRRVEGEPIVVALSRQAKEMLVDVGAADAAAFPCGYARAAGKGKIIFIGSNPSPDILKMVLDQEGLAPYSSAPGGAVTSAIHRRRKDCWVLFLVNRRPDDLTVDVRLNAERLALKSATTYAVENLLTGARELKKGAALSSFPVSLKGRDVTVLKIRAAASRRR